jgi:hypothetical protein
LTIFKDNSKVNGIHISTYNVPWMTDSLGIGVQMSTDPDNLHGSVRNLPSGYKIVPAPREAPIEPLASDEDSCKVDCSYNVINILISLGQALLAAATPHQSRGDQIFQHGYVAFGLTVSPYAVMSIINLMSKLLCLDYGQTYLIDSAITREAHGGGGRFHGVVGRLVEDDSVQIKALETDSQLVGVAGPITFHQDGDHVRIDLEDMLNKSNITKVESVSTTWKVEMDKEAHGQVRNVQNDISQLRNENQRFPLLERQTDHSNSGPA